PIRRSSILFGKVLADGTRIMIQALIVVVVAVAMGVRVETGPGGVLMMLLLAAAFGVAWAGLSNVVALRTGNGELTMMIGILITFPVLFLSTSFMPSALLPDWLDTVAKFNPITYVVEALRGLVNDGWVWADVAQAFAVVGVLAVFTFTAAARAFRSAID
ncbi:MAG: ABC transporter permease, partial [Acidimicrobiia bacterium]|nr:ABC transporter permease [Acidimicrobiia bacterium]